MGVAVGRGDIKPESVMRQARLRPAPGVGQW